MSFNGSDAMPKMPWMINFIKEASKSTPDMQMKAINAPTYLDYLCNLDVGSQVGRKRLTGVACTLKHTNSDINFLKQLITYGVRIAIIDISSGVTADHVKLLENIRKAAQCYSESIGIVTPFTIALEMTSLRIRTGRLEDRTVQRIKLKENETIFITIDDNYKCHCNNNYIYVDYPDLLKLLKPKDMIYINYGDVVLEVKEKSAFSKVKCIVKNGGKLFDHSIVQLPEIPQELNECIKQELINFGIAQEVDVLIISNVKSGSMIKNIRGNIGEKGKRLMLMARIEDITGVTNIDDIIEESDGIVIARGELGVGLPPEKLFIAQKSIIAKCNKAGKPVMCATHILRSMAKNHLPSRAEMLDAANAVLDGSDCLQLSEEVMDGVDPLKCLKMISKICKEAEAAVYQAQVFQNLSSTTNLGKDPTHTIALSAVDFASRNNAAGIIVLTTSGRTARLIAKYRPRCPIIAVTRYGHVARKLNMVKAVIPIYYIVAANPEWEEDCNLRIQYAVTYGKYAGFICIGDVVVLVSGWKKGSGFSNTLRLIYAS